MRHIEFAETVFVALVSVLDSKPCAFLLWVGLEDGTADTGLAQRVSQCFAVERAANLLNDDLAILRTRIGDSVFLLRARSYLSPRSALAIQQASDFWRRRSPFLDAIGRVGDLVEP